MLSLELCFFAPCGAASLSYKDNCTLISKSGSACFSIFATQGNLLFSAT